LQLNQLRQDYACLVDDDLFDRIVTVRKRHKTAVSQMLQALVQFRQEQQWPIHRITLEHLHPHVVQSKAHTVVEPVMVPLPPNHQDDTNHPRRGCIYIRFGQVQLSSTTTVTAKDYHLQFQYTVQEAAKVHPQGEVQVICDFAGTSFGILQQLSTQDVIRAMSIVQTYPIKIKRVDIINTTTTMRIVMQTILALTSRSIRKKVHFGTTSSSSSSAKHNNHNPTNNTSSTNPRTKTEDIEESSVFSSCTNQFTEESSYSSSTSSTTTQDDGPLSKGEMI
jgi:hypothetical protein